MIEWIGEDRGDTEEKGVGNRVRERREGYKDTAEKRGRKKESENLRYERNHSPFNFGVLFTPLTL
jgi:hypothetical protein